MQVGTYCHTLAAALGLSQLLINIPDACDAVRFAGAAYLPFIAWKAFTSSAPSKLTDGAPTSTTLLCIFRQGVATNLLNPKIALLVLALFPQFIDPSKGSMVAQILIFATILNFIGLLVNGSVSLLASKIGIKLAANVKIAKRLNQLLGAVFLGLPCRLALVSER
nr:LysE family translocator [Pseudomonas congelans]